MKAFIKDIKGNKTNPEPEHHEFRFPGGSVNVQRTGNDEYWVHVEVVRADKVLDDVPSHSKPGKIVEGRMDTSEGVTNIYLGDVSHIAFRVSTGEGDD